MSADPSGPGTGWARTLELGTAPDRILARVDITREDEPPWQGRHFVAGDLVQTSGNLYLYVDGVEVGSLFITHTPEGRCVIELGRFDPQQDEWVRSSAVST